MMTISLRNIQITRWVAYSLIFLIFLGIVGVGIHEALTDEVSGEALFVASALLWILLDAYPNRDKTNRG